MSNRSSRLASWTASQTDTSRRQSLTYSTLNSLTLGTGSHIINSITDFILALPRLPHELIIVTCFWAQSSSLDSLIHLLRELSTRAVKQKITISIRISISSLSFLQKLFHTRFPNGYIYSPSIWRRKLYLPFSSCLAPGSDLPGIDLAIKSVFFTPFSVMHSKFVLVDRDICLLPSCNVSWEDWFEGCADLRGPIVELLWEYWEETWGRGDVAFSLRALAAAQARERERGRERGSYSGRPNDQRRGHEHQQQPAQGIDNVSSFEDVPPLSSFHAITSSRSGLDNSKPPQHLPYALIFHQNDTNTDTITNNCTDASPSRTFGTSDSCMARPKAVPTLFLPHPPHPSLMHSFSHLLHFLLFVTPPSPPSTPLNDLTLHLLHTAHTSLYIRTPNLTSPPVIDALLEAVERGVDVRVVTNRRLMVVEQVVTAGTVTAWEVWKLRRRYAKLIRQRQGKGVRTTVDVESGGRTVGKLEVLYYDDLVAAKRRQSTTTQATSRDVGGMRCGVLRATEEVAEERHRIDWRNMPAKAHIKALVVDEEVVLLGSGNMDRASWFTSQELGVAIEDGEIAKQIREALEV